MDAKELKLAYATIENIKKMGIDVPQEILDRAKSLEEQYLNEVVLPALNDYATPLLKPLQSLVLGVAFRKKDESVTSQLILCRTPYMEKVAEVEPKEEEADKEAESQIFLYAQIFDNNYRIIETKEELDIDYSTNHYQGRITFSLTGNLDKDHIIRFYEDGTVSFISIPEMLKRPHNTDYVLPWKYIAAFPIMTLYGAENDTICIYYEDNRQRHLVKFIRMTTILKMNNWEKVVSNGCKILTIGFVPEEMVRQMKIAKAASDVGEIVNKDNQKLCDLLANSIMPSKWDDLKALNIFFDSLQQHPSQGPRLNTVSMEGVIKEYETKDFYVVFDKDKICVSYNASQTMVEAINEMLKRTTIQKLNELFISVDTHPLLSPKCIVEGRASFHKLSNGWWVNTHMSNQTKKKYLEDLARHCGIKLRVVLNMTRKK